MDNTKAILAKCFKNEKLALEPGVHQIDETITFHIMGTVEKKADQHVAPTVSIPWLAATALLLEKVGVTGDEAIECLRQAIEEAMTEGTNTERQIQDRMCDVETAINLVREKLLAKLPKKRRAGSLITKDLVIETVETPVAEPVGYEPYVVLA